MTQTRVREEQGRGLMIAIQSTSLEKLTEIVTDGDAVLLSICRSNHVAHSLRGHIRLTTLGQQLNAVFPVY